MIIFLNGGTIFLVKITSSKIWAGEKAGGPVEIFFQKINGARRIIPLV